MGTIQRTSFGRAPDGQAVELFTLRNGRGAETTLTNYGGIVVTLCVPDRAGQLGDVVLGCEDLAGYLKGHPYFGCLVGRFGNRIAGGRFTLDGQTYTLPCNDGPNHLHGGIQGFDKVVWTAQPRETADGPALELGYLSRAGEEGYPGNLRVTARYTLTEDNALRLDFTATTDAPTVVNLTHHSYFNLAGGGDILGHELMIAAEHYTPVNERLIPTGEVASVRGTPLDFTTPHRIGARINEPHEQLQRGRGYDHNYVFRQPAEQLVRGAEVYEPTSGRVLELFTTAPGTQFYSGNFLDGSLTGKRGQVYQQRHGFCLEPQHFPDSPNQPAFPTTVLRPGAEYRSTMIYRFSVR